MKSLFIIFLFIFVCFSFDMKQIGEGRYVKEEDYYYIKATDATHIKKNQKYDMVVFETHTFKRMNEITINRFKRENKNIVCVYCCSHCSEKCN